MLNCETTLDLLPASLLGALAADELVAVNEHVRGCPTCRAEAESLRGVVADLALAAPDAGVPAPRVKQQLMAIAHESVHGRPIEPVRPRRSFRPWAIFASAAAGVLALILVGAWAVSLQSQVTQQQTRLDRVTQQQAALRQFMLDGQMRSVPVTVDAVDQNIRVALFASEEQVAVAVAGLPPLIGEEVYQCWWADAAQEIEPGTAFRVDANGAGVWVWKRPTDAAYDRMIVTKEPHTGQTHMTGQPLLSVDVSQ